MKRDARPKMMSFSQLPAVKCFWRASLFIFGRSYFVRALGSLCLLGLVDLVVLVGLVGIVGLVDF